MRHTMRPMRQWVYQLHQERRRQGMCPAVLLKWEKNPSSHRPEARRSRQPSTELSSSSPPIAAVYMALCPHARRRALFSRNSN